jgi:hypothetical protein
MIIPLLLLLLFLPVAGYRRHGEMELVCPSLVRKLTVIKSYCCHQIVPLLLGISLGNTIFVIGQ